MSFEDRCKRLLDTALRDHVFGDTEKIRYLPKSGGSFFIRGIFDEPWLDKDTGTEATISTTMISLGVSKVELKDLGVTAVLGDKLERRDQKYVVVDVQTDGQDGLHLLLNESK